MNVRLALIVVKYFCTDRNTTDGSRRVDRAKILAGADTDFADFLANERDRRNFDGTAVEHCAFASHRHTVSASSSSISNLFTSFQSIYLARERHILNYFLNAAFAR